jgi:hypothetical protein
MERAALVGPGDGTYGGIAASGPVSAVIVGALREILAQDLLAALGEIRCASEVFSATFS